MTRRRSKPKTSRAPDKETGNDGTQQTRDGDDDKSFVLDDLFAELLLVEPEDRMAQLDAGLAKYCQNGKHCKKHIKEKGICLSDCKPYGTV
ncbi:hypothetical protein ABBQ32_000855 [Trebouxia sp. C0010 RCD-2024]